MGPVVQRHIVKLKALIFFEVVRTKRIQHARDLLSLEL